MHDIDRTLTELETEGEYESEFESEAGEFEFGDDDDGFGELEFEADDNTFGELEFEAMGDEGPGVGRVFSDAEEMEMASDLLAVSNDAELDQFLGKVFKGVRRKVGRLAKRGLRALKRGLGRKLFKVLRRLGKKALPLIGAAIGGPAGAALASGGGKFFGLELEGLSPEDQEFEAARRFVRLTSDAMANAIAGSQTESSPDQIVRSAMVKAARKHAPGLLRGGASVPAVSGRQRSGRWIRRGNRIVLMGA